MKPNERTPTSPLRRLSLAVAGSRFFKSGRELHYKHSDDWQMTDSLVNKIAANLWLLLHDYGTGDFPPQKVNREAFFEAERNQFRNITFQKPEDRHNEALRKPFSYAFTPRYLRAVASLFEELQKRGVTPPARILELGCGSGWLLEMLVQHGYAACGTTITKDDVENGELRIDSFKAKKLSIDLRFKQVEMENVAQHFKAEFDAAIFHEALHHAFDWREALKATTDCLKPGGWLVLANEPSWLHTFTSYRSAQIFHTVEIGFRRRDIVRVLKNLGYRNIKVSRPLFIPGIRGMLAQLLPFSLVDNSVQSRSYWVYAQKGQGS